MLRCLPGLTVALAATAGMAQQGDPLKSADCRRALDALQAPEAAAAAAAPRAGDEAAAAQQRAALARLKTLRRHAATACLGHADGPPLPQRFAAPPMAVPPAAVAWPAAAAPAAPAGPLLTAPRAFEQPAIVTACDFTGCWASDGSRLQRMGPDLLGPRGFCDLLGAVLHCR